MKAIIIGASSGIGRELAKILAKEGYEVGLVARRKELLDSLQREIPSKTYLKQIDLTIPQEAMKKVSLLIEEMGSVDLAVLCSGVGFIDKDFDWEKEKTTIDVNVVGFSAMANICMKHFFLKRQGHLVGISSIAAIRGGGIYSASKAFVSNYLEGLRRKAFKEKMNVIVTDVKPGFVDTDMAKGDNIFWMVSAKKAAEGIYKAIYKKKSHVYITARWRLIAWLLKLMPRWFYDRFS
jgi:short-subunit dehydrogenase